MQSISFLPALDVASMKHGTLVFGSEGARLSLRVPVLSPAQISMQVAQLLQAQRCYLADRPVSELVEIIDAPVRLWQRPDYRIRKQAERMLPIITGYSSQMITHGLDTMLAAFEANALWDLLRAELNDPRLLDEFRPRPQARGLSRALGPRLTTHVFSGNVPALPAWSLICALLTKSASFGKSASQEPLFAPLFARSLAEVCPEIGQCLAIGWWTGGEQELEKAAFEQADAVIAYGSDQAIGQVRARVPQKSIFLGYGHKLSFALVTREVLKPDTAPEIAAQTAYAVSIFDQQGCVSPHLVYVEAGGGVAPADFAALLAEQMEIVQQRLPRGRIPLEDSSAIRHFRGICEFQELAGEATQLFVSEPDTSWTVVYEEQQPFSASCLNRTVRVHAVGDLAEMLRRLGPVRGLLQSAGVACTSSRLKQIAQSLADAGLSRVCSIAGMPWPSMQWHHDGRCNLVELLRWCDVEADLTDQSVEPLAVPADRTLSSTEPQINGVTSR